MVKFIDYLTYAILFRSNMSENLEIELETIETGYTTVSSTNNYTVEHTVVELETRTSNIYDTPNNDLSEGILLGTNVTHSSVQVIRHMNTSRIGRIRSPE